MLRQRTGRQGPAKQTAGESLVLAATDRARSSFLCADIHSVVIKVGMVGDSQIGKTSLMCAPDRSLRMRDSGPLTTCNTTGSSMSRGRTTRTTSKRSVRKKDNFKRARHLELICNRTRKQASTSWRCAGFPRCAVYMCFKLLTSRRFGRNRARCSENSASLLPIQQVLVLRALTFAFSSPDTGRSRSETQRSRSPSGISVASGLSDTSRSFGGRAS